MKLLIHPVVGIAKQGDVDHHTRVHGTNVFLPRYRTAVSRYPPTMRMGGPRKATRHEPARTARGQELLRALRRA